MCGVFHTFVTDESRGLFAEAVASLLRPGHLWLSIAGLAITRKEANAAIDTNEPRVSAFQITEAVEPFFTVLSMTRTHYGFGGGKTDFPAFASVFERRG